MTLLIFILFIVALVAAAQLRDRGALLVVTTRQGESYRGRRRFELLRPVYALEPVEALDTGTVQELKGVIEVPFRNVAIVQRLPEPLADSGSEPGRSAAPLRAA